MAQDEEKLSQDNQVKRDIAVAEIRARRASLKEGYRLDIDNRAYQGLLIVNGGGAVALLAFLQAIMVKDASSDARELALAVVITIACLVLGLALAVVHQKLRYHTSRAFQFPSVGEHKWDYRKWSLRTFYGSWVVFVVGMGVLIEWSLKVIL